MPPTIDLSRLQEIKKKLKALPKVEKVKTYNGAEALEVLKKDIKTLSRKGYDSKEITKILKQEGLSASVAKVKNILADEEGENESGDDLADGLEPDSSESSKPATPQTKRRPGKSGSIPHGKGAQQ